MPCCEADASIVASCRRCWRDNDTESPATGAGKLIEAPVVGKASTPEGAAAIAAGASAAVTPVPANVHAHRNRFTA